MAVEEYLHASGKKILAGVTGTVHKSSGSITISKASLRGVDENLIRLLEAGVDDLGIAININSIDTGVHVPNSRHYHGCAVDINRVGPLKGPMKIATLVNRDAVHLVQWLIENGVHGGHENGPYAACLFGPVGSEYNHTSVPHITHVHVSLHPAAGE